MSGPGECHTPLFDISQSVETSSYLLRPSITSNTTAFKAGGLSRQLHEWRKLTSDERVLSDVAGISLEFDGEPPRQISESKIFKFSRNEEEIVDSQISDYMNKGIIEKSIEQNDQFVSNIFLREKRNKGYRMILNLKPLNQFIKYHHFKMDSLDTAIALIQENCFMISIDLKDSYYSVNIAQKDRKYLKFRWKGQLYQFTCMPNGLSSAPRIFTKLTKVVFSTLRKIGVNCQGYIDDSFMLSLLRDVLNDQAKEAVALFTRLGFTVNYEKSQLVPVHCIKYLGFWLDSNNMTVIMDDEKAKQIVEFGLYCLSKPKLTIRQAATFIGKIIASFPAVEFGPLHHRLMEREKLRHYN